MASEADFPNALKPDSQDICFIPSGDYKSFLKEHITSEPGYIVDSDGNILGEHGGIEGYTVGQRRGLGIAGQQPMYVLGIDHKKKQVTVGLESELYRETLWTNDVSYIGRQEPVHGTPVTVKIRYKSPECGASIYPYNSNALIPSNVPKGPLHPDKRWCSTRAMRYWEEAESRTTGCAFSPGSLIGETRYPP